MYMSCMYVYRDTSATSSLSRQVPNGQFIVIHVTSFNVCRAGSFKDIVSSAASLRRGFQPAF
jgi:hypothetical protein